MFCGISPVYARLRDQQRRLKMLGCHLDHVKVSQRCPIIWWLLSFQAQLALILHPNYNTSLWWPWGSCHKENANHIFVREFYFRLWLLLQVHFKIEWYNPHFKNLSSLLLKGKVGLSTTKKSSYNGVDKGIWVLFRHPPREGDEID